MKVKKLMTKKPNIATSTSSKPAEAVFEDHTKDHSDKTTISNLNNEIELKDDQIEKLRGLLAAKDQEYRNQLAIKDAEVLELHRQLGSSLAALAELSTLKSLILPFVKSARGEAVTSPEDWNALKGLSL